MSKEIGRCDSCCFGGLCSTHGSCAHYYPYADDLEEEMLIRAAEQGKESFYYEWLEYIEGE